MPLFQELKRRNVFRVAIAYLVTTWLLMQVADVTLGAIEAPTWVLKAILLVLVLGFPPVLIFAWAYELTPEGLKREKDVDRSQSITHVTARRLDYTIIVMLILAGGYMAWEKFLYEPAAVAETRAVAPASAADRAGGGAGTSIAVLPFVNLSPDPEQEYFSDGISEELLNVLARYPGLRVAARTSSFQFKGEKKDISEIARQLNVNHVLEGSVRKSGTRLRITAQLIDAETGFHLWSETYDRELDDVFAIQDEISAAIGEALRVEMALQQDPLSVPRVAASENTAAYEAFLQGRHLINQRGNRNIRTAVEHLERCVRLDPDFAPCHAWLSIGYALLLAAPKTYGDLTLAEVRERAIPHYETALELDPNLAEAHGAKALLAVTSTDDHTALEAATRALELNPVYVDALNWRRIAAINLGEYAESRKMLDRILEIDPLSIIGRLNYVVNRAAYEPETARKVAESLAASNAWTGYLAMAIVDLWPSGNLSSGLEWLLKAYRLEPRDELGNRFIMAALSYVGEYDEARRISSRNTWIVDIEQGRPGDAAEKLERELQADPANVLTMINLADALHAAGRFEAAQKYYADIQRQSPSGLVFDPDDVSTSSQVRMAYGLRRLGQADAAKAALGDHHEDFAKRREADILGPFEYLAEAMAQAMEGDEAAVFDAIRAAMSLGLRSLSAFREPVFESLADHPDMLALKAEMQRLLDVEHGEILQLICHHNPAYDTWQPRRETCADVPRS